MIRPRIVATHNVDRNVTVTRPTAYQLRLMTLGGWGSGMHRGFLEDQVWRSIEAGRIPSAAVRFFKAEMFGGCTTAEALAIIRDHDVAHIHHDIILMDGTELPDRTFRNAWMRTPNGGVAVDLKRARRIQLDKIKTHVSSVNARRLRLCRKPIRPMWSVIANGIRHARDADELKRVGVVQW